MATWMAIVCNALESDSGDDPTLLASSAGSGLGASCETYSGSAAPNLMCHGHHLNNQRDSFHAAVVFVRHTPSHSGRQASGPLSQQQCAHDQVAGLALHPSQSLAATSGGDGSVLLWAPVAVKAGAKSAAAWHCKAKWSHRGRLQGRFGAPGAAALSTSACCMLGTLAEHCIAKHTTSKS
jgi:hypothetical protein